MLRKTQEALCNRRPDSNAPIDDDGWRQATLPVAFGGLGIRSCNDLSFPAFLSSLKSSHKEILLIPSEFWLNTDMARFTDVWSLRGLDIPENTTGLGRNQLPVYIRSGPSKIKSAPKSMSPCRRLAVPNPSLVTLLDDKAVRIGISLRLGLKLCVTHTCRSGGTIDSFGLHPLACKRSTGRFPKHTALNEVIRRALDSAGFPSILEPPGLDRGDGKRPDGMTIFPFRGGKPLVWDSTCTDTFSSTNMNMCAVEPGYAANNAESSKIKKYSALSDRFTVQPIAVETSGSIGPKSASRVVKKARRLC